MSFPWPQWTDRLKELQAMNLSAAEIADRLAIESGCVCSRSAVIGKLKRLGLSPKSTPPHGGHDRVSFEKGSPPPRAIRVNPFNLRSLKPPPQSKLPALSPDQKEYILGQGKRLNDFTDHPATPEYCRWPINEPRRDEFFLFCGQKVTQGCPYCGYHARMAYGRAA